MPPEKLVLFKSRAQRLVEMIVMPTVLLPVGPVMRPLLGDGYSVFYGLLALVPPIVVVCMLSNKLATRFGGEWLTQPERLRRLIAETAVAPRWQNALAMMAMSALMLLGFFLIVDPLDHFGSSIGGAPLALGILAVMSVLAGGQALFAQRQLSRADVREEEQPVDHYWCELRRILPWTYLACALGVITGVALGLQFDDSMRFGVFVGTFLVVSSILRQLFLSRSASKQLYPTALDAGLRSKLLLGLLGWGVPMGMMFSGMMILMVKDMPGIIVIGMIGVAIVLSALGGLAFGAYMHLVRRLVDPQQDRSR
jgi:hypothetical protein